MHKFYYIHDVPKEQGLLLNSIEGEGEEEGGKSGTSKEQSGGGKS